MRICCLRIFLIYSSGGSFVGWSRSICAILLEGMIRNILNLDQCFRRCRLWIYLIYSSGDPFVWQRRTICAILVEGT